MRFVSIIGLIQALCSKRISRSPTSISTCLTLPALDASELVLQAEWWSINCRILSTIDWSKGEWSIRTDGSFGRSVIVTEELIHTGLWLGCSSSSNCQIFQKYIKNSFVIPAWNVAMIGGCWSGSDGNSAKQSLNAFKSRSSCLSSILFKLFEKWSAASNFCLQVLCCGDLVCALFMLRNTGRLLGAASAL